MNTTPQLTDTAAHILNTAANTAQTRRHRYLTTEHLLHALAETADQTLFGAIANRIGHNPQHTLTAADQILQQENRTVTDPQHQPTLSQDLNQTLHTAQNTTPSTHIGVAALLTALLEHGTTQVKHHLQQTGITEQTIQQTVTEAADNPNPGLQNNNQNGNNPLQQWGTDLVAAAKNGELDPVIGRDTEIRRLIQVLSRRRKNNPVLIGEPGVGKTAVVEGLAHRIHTGDIPTGLADNTIVSLDFAAMLAGAEYRGTFEKRVKETLEAVTATQGHTITFVDELHTVVGAGNQPGAMDVANMLKPLLARGDLKMIGATTLTEYRNHIEKDVALERRFQPVHIEPPTVDDTIRILRGLKERYENHHQVTITDPALTAAAELSNRYIPARRLPDKAIDLIDEAAAKRRIEIDSKPEQIDELTRKCRDLEIQIEGLEHITNTDKQHEQLLGELQPLQEQLATLNQRWDTEKQLINKIQTTSRELETAKTQQTNATRLGDLTTAAELKYGKIPELEQQHNQAVTELAEKQQNGQGLLTEEVTEHDVASVVNRWTGIPVGKLIGNDLTQLAELENQLSRRVLGQPAAIKAVTAAVKRSRIGLGAHQKPVGVFLFSGPTGVGKTELAKTLTEALFHDETAITRIDMSEYGERHTVARLIGAPPGYVGYGDGGQLTEPVRRRPYTVILLDEIEKAHQNVHNLLLQVFDDGRLTDGEGRTVDFTNTVIIMTSNLGSSYQQNNNHTNMTAAIEGVFPPEFVNRIDETVWFNHLNKNTVHGIVKLRTEETLTTLQEQNINLTVTTQAEQWLTNQGHDPIFGARPIKKLIQTRIVDTIVDLIVNNQLNKNRECETVIVNGELTVHPS